MVSEYLRISGHARYLGRSSSCQHFVKVRSSEVARNKLFGIRLYVLHTAYKPVHYHSQAQGRTLE